MTSQPEQEYRITEKQLSHAEEHHIKFIDDAKTIRSRPVAPATQDLSHVREDRHGCLTCIRPDCPIWQAADQNCWRSQAEHDAAIRNALLDDICNNCGGLAEGGEQCKTCYVKSLRNGGEQR